VSSARRFAREIEARWSALLERPVVLGERDWQFISDWHARDIPLTLVVEAMDGLGEKLKRRRSKPRNLGAVAPFVEDAWRAVVEGRLDQQDTAAGPGPSTSSGSASSASAGSWRRCADALPAGDSLRDRLETLLMEIESGADPAACDAALERDLSALLPPRLLAELSASVERNLAGFRERMAPGTWKATVERALISAARRKLDLPHLG